MQYTCSEHGLGRVSRAQNLLAGPPCCRHKISRPHAVLLDIIKSIDPDAEVRVNDRTVLRPLELDVVLPAHRLAVEINGVYWHSDKPSYHANKTKAARSAGLDLVHLWDYEITNTPELVTSLLRSRMGRNQRLYARKLDVVSVTADVAKTFFSMYHMHGHRALGPNSVSLALVDNRRVYQMLSVDKPLFDKQAALEITRSATRAGYTVVGGFSRLLRRLSTLRPDASLVTYADLRLFTGDSYVEAGFVYDRTTRPNYWYFPANSSHDSEPISRYAAQKHKLRDLLDGYDPDLSEHQNMIEHGFVRVYDCGNAIYRMTLRSNSS